MKLCGLPGNRVSLLEQALCFRQLETMLNAGVPLADGLEAVSTGAFSPAFQVTLTEVYRGLLQGGRPSQLMAQHPQVFSREVVGILQVGEATGRLHQALGSLATDMERRYRQQQKLTSVLVYPAAIGLFSLAMVAFLATVLLPRMAAFMESLHVQPPAWMALLMSAVGILCNPWLLLWLVELGFVAGWLLLRWIQRTQEGDEWRDSCLQALPVLGPLYQQVVLLRFCSLLGQTLGCGCSLMQGLRLSHDGCDSPSFRAGLQQAMQRVLEGDSCSSAMRATGQFPNLFLHLLAVGEESSSLEPCLLRLQNLLEADLEDRWATATSLIEPLVMIILGSVVGTLVLLCFLPITQLVQQL